MVVEEVRRYRERERKRHREHASEKRAKEKYIIHIPITTFILEPLNATMINSPETYIYGVTTILMLYAYHNKNNVHC